VSLPPFQRVVDELGPALRRHVAALVGVTDADDVVQETLISALGAYPGLPVDANVRAWLWTIARNKAIDGHRRRGRRPQTTPWPDHDVPAPGADGQPGADGDEELWARVRALPDGQRLAVTLRFVDDLSYAQIGEHCGCSAAAARQRVYEGLQALRKEVSP
jgi:RNA polymerase sigma factor (sigma-70 family)